jgi:uncharacterized membrane protein YkvA (DUF1232 family)/nucleoside 2-deoxyribosyltransferase
MRQLIAGALGHDAFTGELAAGLAQALALRGQFLNPLQLGQCVNDLRNYVRQVPDLLEAIAAAARQAGIFSAVSPMLDTAEQYFLSPVDVIPDHLGLIGLIDDAYLAHSLMQAVSDHHRQITGAPLLSTDLSVANAQVRDLIGEPHASQLDGIVASALQVAPLRDAMRNLVSRPATLSISDEPWSRDETLPPADRDALFGLLGRETASAHSASPSGRESAQSEPSEWRGGAVGMLEALIVNFEERVESGEISANRQQTLAPILAELRQMLHARPEELAEMMTQGDRLRELMARMTTAIAEPSRAGIGPAEGSRARALLALVAGVKQTVFAESRRHNLADEEHQTLVGLYERLARAGGSLHELGEDDAAAYDFERESLRQLALEARSYAARHHLLLAHPLWTAREESPNPNAVFYSGGRAVGRQLERICESMSLELCATVTQKNYARARWRQLWSCNVAVFDLSAKGGPDLAGACYELGLALALGRAIVIASPKGHSLPFDVAIEPVQLERDGRDGSRLSAALDEVVYGVQFGNEGSSLMETVQRARGLVDEDSENWQVQQTLGLFDNQVVDDPIKTRHLMRNLLGYLGPEGPVLLFPAWPGHYPDPSERRCFHVMPFGADWSDSVREVAKQACEAAGVRYIRGDQPVEARIITSIWEEICRASHVLVDITGFNANVALEAGLAHAIGRPVWIVCQGEEALTRLFPAIAKLRVHAYSRENGGASLMKTVNRLLRRPAPA